MVCRLACATAIAFLLARPASAETHYPTAAEAEATLASGDLDTLYLAFGPLKPGQHPDGDARIAALLTRAAQAAARKKDPALAVGFATKARQLDPTSVDACLAEADSAVVLKNVEEAGEALDAALRLAPTNWAVVLRRARVARSVRDVEIARNLLKQIPPDAPEAAAAREELAAIDADEAATAANAPITEPQQQPVPRRSHSWPGMTEQPVATAPSEESIPGYAARTSEHFRIIYSEGQRDFGQKAEYEQQCLDLFERAYDRVRQTLGEGTAQPTEVVLYSRQEFELHYGGQFGNAVLGFYAGKIRMNHAEAIDDSFFHTAVHEYTHAVIDSMSAHHRIPSWLHEGLARWVERTSAGDEPLTPQERRMLQRVSPLPTLAQLGGHSFAELGSNLLVAVAYAKSALAVDLIIHSDTGLVGLERAIRGTADGTPFEQSFGQELGTERLAALDGEVAQALESSP